MLTSGRGGFTMVEITVALVILSVAVLGLAGSASSLATAASTAELRAQAVHSALDRLARVDADDRYGGLDTLYAGTETGVLPVPGSTRVTTIEHVSVTSPDPLDYKIVRVVVSAPLLGRPVERSLIVAAP